MDNIGFQTYGNYSSDNYGAHALQFFTPQATYWFSYKTLVAFQVLGRLRIVRENDWGPTTGKHLNWIDGGDHYAKKERVDGETFKQTLSEQLAELETA